MLNISLHLFIAESLSYVAINRVLTLLNYLQSGERFMRIFVTIPHFFREVSVDATNNSQRIGSGPERLRAVAATISALHQHFGNGICGLDHQHIKAHPVGPEGTCVLDVVICTTGNHHLLSGRPLLKPLFQHHSTDAEPLMLGFECHRLLREAQGKYDYYGYVEDDIVVHDPMFFSKRRQFDRTFGPEALLQPNRCELSIIGPIFKMYVDYRVHRSVTEAYQNIDDQPTLEMLYGDETVCFERPSYPSAGCFFLNAEQLDRWVKSPNFLDGDTSYLKNPLDSAATLSIMKTFRIYKPVLSNASFLEVVHSSTRWIGRRLRH